MRIKQLAHYSPVSGNVVSKAKVKQDL